jgi:hypothetical protein
VARGDWHWRSAWLAWFVVCTDFYWVEYRPETMLTVAWCSVWPLLWLMLRWMREREVLALVFVVAKLRFSACTRG